MNSCACVFQAHTRAETQPEAQTCYYILYTSSRRGFETNTHLWHLMPLHVEQGNVSHTHAHTLIYKHTHYSSVISELIFPAGIVPEA